MTHRPILDGADQTPALCTPSSANGTRPADLHAAERAAADLLTTLGIDLEREDRRATPAPMTRAYAELFARRAVHVTEAA